MLMSFSILNEFYKFVFFFFISENEFQIEENAHDLIFLSESLKLEFLNYAGNKLETDHEVVREEVKPG